MPAQQADHKNKKKQPENRATAVQKEQQAEMFPILEKERSWGEALMPFLLAAMETCWMDAVLIGLANTSILGTTDPLLPLWLPFPLLTAFAFLTRWLDSTGSNVPASSSPQRRRFSPLYALRAALILVAVLFVAWISIYAGHKNLLDKGWFLDLSATIVQIKASAFHIVCVLAFALLLCQQGNFLAHARSTPTQVFKMFQLGLFAVLFLIPEWLVLATLKIPFQNGTLVLFLLALFFCLSLITHTLARVIFVHRQYPIGLIDNVGAQERLVLRTVVILICLFLFIVLTLGYILGHMSPGITGVTMHQQSATNPPIIPVCNNRFCPTPTHMGNRASSNNSGNPGDRLARGIAWLIPTLYIIFLFSIAGGGAALGLFVWRRWCGRKRGQEDSHESLWSWLLFWQQFKGLISVLSQRFAFLTGFIARWRMKKGTQILSGDQATTGPQNIRTLYCSLLSIAARHGCSRERHEMPYEFCLRLGTTFVLRSGAGRYHYRSVCGGKVWRGSAG